MFTFFLAITLFSLTIATHFDNYNISADLSNGTVPSARKSRVFFLFPLFTPFRRKACYSGSRRGVCYTAYQCNLRGGQPLGTCASGRGVCCVFQYSCGGVSSAQNFTYFSSPNYPSAYSGGSRCSVTITKANYSVCQMKINILDLSLAPPLGTGVCSNDILSNSVNSIRLCGENKGQHLYVDFSSGDSFTLSVDTNSAYSFDRSWDIEIIQIPCSSGVPGGCVQYFNTTSGTVSSFNYGSTDSPSLNTDGSPGNRQIAGLNYGVCVKPVAGYCSIQWSQSSSSLYTFTVSSATDALDTTVLGTSNAVITATNCTTNYLIIPNPSQNGVPVPYDRFCGNGFITTISSSKPYVLYVVTASASSTASATASDIGNHGFSLNYRLLLCQ